MDAFILQLITDLATPLLFVIIAATLFTLSLGADVLVDQAVSLSLYWGVPKMIIGATIVSIGTTLPEATVSVMGALQGNADLALGNAIGSIIVDTGLVIGIAALMGRLPVDDVIIRRQGKLQFVAVLLLTCVALPFFGGRIHQISGIVFLMLLALYLYSSMKWSSRNADQAEQIRADNAPLFSQIIKLAGAIALVILSSKLLIPTVALTAQRVGIPQSIIAATLIAFGTSLPELVTAISAVRKGHGELAIGNVVGADILNVLFVVGGAAAVTPTGLLVPVNFYLLQIPAMLIIISLFRYFTITAERHITRREGLILAVIYFIYLALNYIIA